MKGYVRRPITQDALDIGRETVEARVEARAFCSLTRHLLVRRASITDDQIDLTAL